MKSRILIVSADQAIRGALCTMLRAADYEALQATDGQEAVARCQSRSIDLMILDLDAMSDSGWRPLQGVTDFDPMLPIIVLTGLMDQPDSALGAHIGAVLEKPVDAAVLLEQIQRLLSESRETRWHRLSACLANTSWSGSPSTRVLQELRDRLTGRVPVLPYRSLVADHETP